MVCLIKKRGIWERRSRLDVWGYHRLFKRKYNNYAKQRIRYKNIWLQRKIFFSKRYVYELRKRYLVHMPKRWKKDYLNFRYLRRFFLIVRLRQYRRNALLAKKDTQFSFINRYLLFLESRLFTMIYRSNFATNLFTIKFLIDSEIFYVNERLRTFSNYCIPFAGLFSVDPRYISIFYFNLLRKLKYRRVFQKVQNLYVNYFFFFAFYYKPLSNRQYMYPIRIDILRAFEYY